MPIGIHSINLDLPIQSVWKFVSVMGNWAPLVPGYITHEVLSERESTWEFKGDLGLIKKKISLKVEIIEWSEPNKVTFNLIGLNEKIHGHGYFLAEKIGAELTKITGCLDISAKGTKGPMANALLKSYVPQTTLDLIEAVAEKVREIQGVNT